MDANLINTQGAPDTLCQLHDFCSVFKAEGEQQIQTFVAHHTDALLMPSPGHMLPQSGAGATRIPDNLMREHDGFYYACLEKRFS